MTDTAMTRRSIYVIRTASGDLMGYQPAKGSAMVSTLEDAIAWHETRSQCAIMGAGDIHWCQVHDSTFPEDAKRCFRAELVTEESEQAWALWTDHSDFHIRLRRRGCAFCFMDIREEVK